jgi:hypothetical protein
MSANWDEVRRRHRLVHEVLTHAQRQGAAAVAAAQDEIEQEYAEEGLAGFLLDVHRTWQRAFDARLDAVLENAPGDLATAVTEMWGRLATDFPGTRLVLDAYAEHPTVARAAERHRRRVLAGTGVDLAALPLPATNPTDGARHGREPSEQPSRENSRENSRDRGPRRGRLRLRSLCPGLHRRPLPPAGAAAHMRSGA